MISKSTISKSMLPAVALVAMSLASPAFAQIPPGYYAYAPGYYYGNAPGFAGPYAYSSEQPGPFGWAPYGYGGGWPPGSAASVEYNIHTPPNH
jgi:hypothetical protein